MSDLLEGWAYPISETIFGLDLLEHTFIKAPNNGPAYFDCFGGHEGAGVHILQGASGNGKYAVANCYRLPLILPDTAGLGIYGTHGVCHQAANRFLWSACGWISGPTVKNALGYTFSYLFYGAYGRPLMAPPPPAPWPPSPLPPTDFLLIYAKCSLLGGPALHDDEPPPPETPTGYEQRLSALHYHRHKEPEKFDPNVVITEELRLLVEDRLGADFDSAKIHEIRNRALASAYEVSSGDLRGEAFAQEINATAVRCLDELEEHLGAENYTRLMSMEPGARYALMDPRLAERAGSGGNPE